MKSTHWLNYPELTKSFRTKEEDDLSKNILILLKKFDIYLRKHKIKKYDGDLQGAVHLFQGILIDIQKERYNKRNIKKLTMDSKPDYITLDINE